MSLDPLLHAPAIVQVHVAGALTSVISGGVVMALPKGTALHLTIGRVFAAAMMLVAISSFWVIGRSGHYSAIHLLSVLTIITVPKAIWLRRTGRIRAHAFSMISLYVSLLVAGAFTFLPYRIMGQTMFGP